jgi:hypothetical protein
MTQTHPITPPPELVQQWEEQWCDMPVIRPSINSYMAAQAAQWGADQELEACCEWLKKNIECHITIGFLRDARRPEPPSLKKQALHELNDVYSRDKIDDSTYDTICRALEALPE